MKIRSALTIALALLASSLTSKAGTVTGVSLNWDPTYTYYGDGNVVCYLYTFSSTDQSVDMGTSGAPIDQYGAGTLGGNITTAGDPTLTLNNTINNDTGITWTGYVIDVNMAQTFTISGVSVLNPGWSVFSVTQPAVSPGPFNGQIVLHGGTVPDGSILSFTYSLTFGGSTSFTETLTPINVPEPGAISLLGISSLLFGGWTAARRRSSTK